MMKENLQIQLTTQSYLDTASCEIHFLGKGYDKKVRIEPILAQMLTLLATRQNTVSRADMIQAVWDGNEGVGHPAITRNVYKIRKIFEDHGLENPVDTLPKVGYRLKTPDPKKTFFRSRQKWLTMVLLLLLTLVSIKLIYPGVWTTIIHMLEHRLLH